MKFEKGGGSHNEKPTCVACGKRNYRKCLASSSGFYGCGKDNYKARGRYVMQGVPSSPIDYVPINRHF